MYATTEVLSTLSSICLLLDKEKRGYHLVNVQVFNGEFEAFEVSPRDMFVWPLHPVILLGFACHTK